MGVNQAIDVTASERQTVLALLERHLPGTEAWVYGSRARWTSRPQSDLDLVVFATPEQRPRVGDLREAFDESDLPFRVDLFVWDDVPESFRGQIRTDRAVLKDATRPPNGNGIKITTHWQHHNVLDLIQSGVLAVGDGYRARNGELAGTGLPFARAGNVNDGFRFSKPDRFPEDRLHRVGDKISRLGDVVFTSKGTVGRFAFVRNNIERFVYSPQLCYWRSLNRDIIHPYFLYCWMRGPEFSTQFRSVAGQTDMADYVSLFDQRRMFITLPPVAEQRAIAHILGTLDDKIELNRRMNATLEAMARALFKSWFVDFDPVRAKMEGRDTGLPKDIADLFPDRLVDSKFEEMPEGWTVGTFGDVVALESRGVDPSDLDDDMPYIGLNHMPRRSVALGDWGTANRVSSKKSAFARGDTLFGKLRPYFHKVGIAPVNGICSTDILVLRARMPWMSAFVLACASSSAFVAYTHQTSTGTRMPRVTWQTATNYPLHLPTERVARCFQDLMRPLLERIVETVHATHNLRGLRDALLPTLISGELRVRDAELGGGSK